MTREDCEYCVDLKDAKGYAGPPESAPSLLDVALLIADRLGGVVVALNELVEALEAKCDL